MRELVDFRGRILLLGSGSVSRCLQTMLLQRGGFDCSRLTVLDRRPLGAVRVPTLDAGASFVEHRLTPENISSTLEQHLEPGDFLVNLTCSVSSQDLIGWCHTHGVLYVDTSVEVWDPEDCELEPTADQTLYRRHHDLRRMAMDWSGSAPTAVVEHGANPGLVNHWVKRGLLELGERLLDTLDHTIHVDAERRQRIGEALATENYARLAMESGTKVIQISERDTQISRRPKEVGEFVNTWSVDGFHEEGTAPAELGWGTHEHRMPEHGRRHDSGVGNQIYLEQAGIDTYVRSWVPLGGPIIGMVVRHGEAFTISDYLTVRSEGQLVYRPTVYYAYLPSDAAVASLHELRMTGYRLPKRQRIMDDDISSGIDEVGVLLLGHDLNGWWVGSQLSIGEARAVAANQNATTVQVAASVLGAIGWIIENPERGLCVPDDLDHRAVLASAAPYLGPCPSVQTHWTPRLAQHEPFRPAARDDEDAASVWQFENFLFPAAGHTPRDGSALVDGARVSS